MGKLKVIWRKPGSQENMTHMWKTQLTWWVNSTQICPGVQETEKSHQISRAANQRCNALAKHLSVEVRESRSSVSQSSSENLCGNFRKTERNTGHRGLWLRSLGARSSNLKCIQQHKHRKLGGFADKECGVGWLIGSAWGRERRNQTRRSSCCADSTSIFSLASPTHLFPRAFAGSALELAHVRIR